MSFVHDFVQSFYCNLEEEEIWLIVSKFNFFEMSKKSFYNGNLEFKFEIQCLR